ncbi:MAG: HTH domain-containing protein [Flavobacteriales bacterium]|nr:HTH domain-containing protein [Flavobacteriales bacterium]
MDIRTIIKIDDLIKREATGSPAQLANRLNLSERATYKYLKFMKEELKAPIAFNKSKGAYNYTNSGKFNFIWR